MAVSTDAFSAFDVSCANCDDSADVDVTVFDATTGKTARDTYACDDCADDISVPDGYAVTIDAL